MTSKQQKQSEKEELLVSENQAEMEDFFETTENELDQFEEYTWNKGEGYKIPGFPVMEQRLEGLEAGLYLFAGESNSGKSAAMMNLLFDVATHPDNNLFGVYYSLDDSKNEIIPRVIAMNELIPIGVASKPQRYQNKIDNAEEGSATYQDWLNKRTEGIQRLKGLKEKFKVVDGNTIKNAEQLHDHIKKVKIFLNAIDPECNLIIAIDALNDIRFASKNYKPGNELNSAIAKEVKEWAVEFDIPILGSTHLRKLNGNRRPVLDDLKESGEYVYEASVVWLVHNDVSKNKQAANVYYNAEGVEEKMPVLELDWAKNKKSSFKGRTYQYFTPEMSKLNECQTDVMKRYDALVYEV
ncbi:DnaB-like helicase C-terminal domain-containing protein [Bacillus spizizenii]|nr:DnaB helicase C-terminal domain-containing protein [Bacillus spizizenii]MCY8890542.1 DnaB helicase C-terminal domain-containing protein [Bacillus spizizenii]MEC0842001.1 DnaB-like helicase C-terminal domain-containing protein [Bacillus spizizenii]